MNQLKKKKKTDPIAMIAIAIALIGAIAIFSATKSGTEAGKEWAAGFARKFSIAAGLAIGAAFAMRYLLVRAGIAAMLGTSAPLWLAAAAVLVATGAWNSAAASFGGPTVGDKYLPIDGGGAGPGEGIKCPPGKRSVLALPERVWKCV